MGCSSFYNMRRMLSAASPFSERVSFCQKSERFDSVRVSLLTCGLTNRFDSIYLKENLNSL